MATAVRERNRKRLKRVMMDTRTKMYTGRLVNGVASTAGAPTNKTWVRYPANSTEETLAWGNVLRPDVPVWVQKNKLGQNEIVGGEYVEGTVKWGNALESVAAHPIINEIQPTSVGEFGILPGRIGASPLGSTYIRIQAFEHRGGRYPTTDIDVGAEYPTLDGAYRCIGVYVDPDTNTETVFGGEEVFDRNDFTDADKLSVPDGMYPVGAVIVYDDNDISSANTFEDWRLHHSSKGAAGGSSAHEILIDDIAQTPRGGLNILSSDWLVPVAADDAVNDETEVAYTLDPTGVPHISSVDPVSDKIPLWDASGSLIGYATPYDLGASGISGALVQLDQQIAGVGGQAYFEFTSIPNTGAQIIAEVIGRTSNASGQSIRVRVGTGGSLDTGSNYDTQRLYGNGGAGADRTNTTSFDAGAVPGTGTASGPAGTITVTLKYYASGFWKTIGSENMYPSDATGGVLAIYAQGEWRNTAAIDILRIYPASGDFVEGSICTLWMLT